MTPKRKKFAQGLAVCLALAAAGFTGANATDLDLPVTTTAIISGLAALVAAVIGQDNTPE